MEFYLSDILEIVVEYIYRNKSKNKLINSFYLPIISFININKKYYRFDFCKKHIGLCYNFNVKTDINNIIDEYIIALNSNSNLPVSFETETFFEIIELLISLCKSVINKIKYEIENNDKIKSYHNELELWIKSDCFIFIQNRNPQGETNYYFNI
jgi:hypothetical protein